MLHLHSYARALVIVWSESRRVYSSVVVKETVPLKFLFAPKHLVALEMVQYAFLAPRLGRKVPQEWNFGVKWLRDPTTKGAPTHLTPHNEWGTPHLTQLQHDFPKSHPFW